MRKTAFEYLLRSVDNLIQSVKPHDKFYYEQAKTNLAKAIALFEASNE